MEQKNNIHKDFKSLSRIYIPFKSKTAIRLLNILVRIIRTFIKKDKSIKIVKDKIKSFDGAQIKIQIYEPTGVDKNASCLLFIHGGAFVLTYASNHKKLAWEHAMKTNCIVVLVDYRLALDHPYPTGVEDCYAALEWIDANAGKLGVDRNRIAVHGDSAGGALSAAVAQMARDRKGPGVCFQMLIYPVIDCEQNTQSIHDFIDSPVWDSKKTEIMWNYYLKYCGDEAPPYASPMKAESLKDLPPAYVEVAEFDPLRDEGINYANRLQEDGREVELFQTKGTVHGFDSVLNSEITKESVRRRVNSLNMAFQPNHCRPDSHCST